MHYHLRRLEAKDAPLMLEWMHDHDVVENLEADFSTKTIADALQFIEQSRREGGGELHLACVDDNDIYLGTVSLKHINRKNCNAEFAICFRRCAHGTGASSYATEEIQRIAFAEQGLEKLYLYLYSTNERANHFYQKEGFTFEGRQRQQVMYKGRFVDVLWYGITKAEWEVKRQCAVSS